MTYDEESYATMDAPEILPEIYPPDPGDERDLPSSEIDSDSSARSLPGSDEYFIRRPWMAK